MSIHSRFINTIYIFTKTLNPFIFIFFSLRSKNYTTVELLLPMHIFVWCLIKKISRTIYLWNWGKTELKLVWWIDRQKNRRKTDMSKTLCPHNYMVAHKKRPEFFFYYDKKCSKRFQDSIWIMIFMYIGLCTMAKHFCHQSSKK